MAANGGFIVGDEETQPTKNAYNPHSSTPMSDQWLVGEAKKNHANPPLITLGERLGLADFFDLNVWRASIGELLGTAVLVFALDTIVISSVQTDTKMPKLLLSILIAVIVAILLLATHPVSGGHINPIVSFSAALVGFISLSRAVIYITAQCLGAVIGALALKAVVSHKIADTFSLGGCTVNVIAPGPNGPILMGLEMGQALWLEIFCAFVFLYASIWMAYDRRQVKELGHTKIFMIVGIVMGLLVFISTSVTQEKGYGGVGLNPARCFGAAVVRGGHLWNGHWVFWVGPGIACFWFYLYTKMIPTQHFHWDGYKHKFFKVLQAFAGPN